MEFTKSLSSFDEHKSVTDHNESSTRESSSNMSNVEQEDTLANLSSDSINRPIFSEKELVSIKYEPSNVVEDKGEQTVMYEDECTQIYEIEDEMEGSTITECFHLPSLTDEEQKERNELSFLFDNLEEEEPCVKFKVRFTTDGCETATTILKSNTSIIKIKDRLATIFRITVDNFKLTSDGLECDDESNLFDYYISPLSGMIEFGIHSTEVDRILAPGEFSRYVPIIEKFHFNIPRDVGEPKAVGVIVENQCFVKEWLGGYKNQLNNVEYHHVRTQTLPRRRPPGSLPQFSRQTQTPCFPFKELAIDTTKHKATQMWRTDHYVATVYDKIVSTDPDRFVSTKGFSQFHELVAIVVFVQRFCRNFRIRRAEKLEELRQQKEREAEEEYRKQLQTMLLEGNRRLIIGGTFPITRDDFYVLYLALGKWWRKEMANIKNSKSNESKIAACNEILLKEINLLRSIEVQRTNSRKEVLLKQEMQFLATCARPIIFRNQEGVMSSIDTVYTQQSREHQEIVSSYLNLNSTKEERIDKLQTLIVLLRNYNSYEHTEEIINLLQRECDLLAIGINNNQLKSLRDRILQLILYLLHNPVVNPSSSKFKKPSLPKMYKKWHQCFHCNKIKPASEFNVHLKLIKFECCYSCEWMKNISTDRMDLTPFIRILEQVRRMERTLCCRRSFIYILRPVGMRYLTTCIWLSKSILSDVSNLNDVGFFRFNRDEAWSPWNCILLTQEEGKIHFSLDNVNEFYSPRLLKIIHWRHMRGRMHFMPLVLNDRYLDESKLWDNCQDTGKLLHPAHINRFAQTDDFEHVA